MLSRIVFGKNIVKAQVCLLQYVQAHSSILIVGGGTGWILEELTKQYPSGLIIDYVENSAEMIALSKSRNCGSNVVNYIKLPIEDFKSSELYNVILTPFVFDNFTHEKAGVMFARLNAMLKKQGNWLYADFVHNENEGKLWQKFLLKTMYLFFRITTDIETHELADVEVYFEDDYEKVFERRFYLKFIKSLVYRKR